MQVRYFRRAEVPLARLFALYNLPPPEPLLTCSANALRDVVAAFGDARCVLLRYARGRLQREFETHPDQPALPETLRFLFRDDTAFLVKAIDPCQRCEACGSHYMQHHTCNTRRCDFFFHHVNAHTNHWWETISFSPLGAPPTRRLFLVYDIETYTWHGSFGKQLAPFLLVLTYRGDPELCELAQRLTRNLHWQEEEQCFHLLNPTKNTIGASFLALRSALQQELCALLWDTFAARDAEALAKAAADVGCAPEDLTFAQLQKLPLKGTPTFIELIIIGHNISGFDEVVLAAQTLSLDTAVGPGFEITRNFMPRNGKILFNDITYGLPNPAFASRADFSAWEQGRLELSDLHQQYVRVMVRDTFALTHTSLRNAALAYDLASEKLSCPYAAVNEFYMTGTYQKDCDGFPEVGYWESRDEYLRNKEEWLKNREGAYDIVRETLTYCQRDVTVTAQLVLRLQESYRHFVQNTIHLPAADFNVFQRPTISANSHAIFKQILYRAQRPGRASLDTYLMAPSGVMYDFVRESIRGGRCYPTWLGVCYEPIYVYDICGMYASALTHPMPVGRPLNPLERAIAAQAYTQRLIARQEINYFDPELLPGIFVIDADPPEETKLDVLPPFCSRKGGRLCWTNESLRGEVATSIDVITLHNRGWAVRLLPDERTTIFPEWACIAREYVEVNIAAKERADREKNPTLRSIAKLLSNALYGSFATKLDNKKIIFENQLDERLRTKISQGQYNIKSSSVLETENLCAELMPQFVAAYPPDSDVSSTPAVPEDEAEAPPLSFIAPDPRQGHVTVTYKPITFLDCDDVDLCVLTLQKTTDLVDNNRYPSQIASFVLAWTRAFMSEWAQFLYREDHGIPLEHRQTKSVYGDTDSLFLTELGHQLMLRNGKKRLKRNGGPLVFDPDHPSLTWLVDCETVCASCGHDAYSVESVFLAPKLYALKQLRCPACNSLSKGKLRAKGHATSSLTYHYLKDCFQSAGITSRTFNTSRLTLKRALASSQSHVQPFTVTETTLRRTLRPWNDMTLRPLDHQRLVPFSNAHPNPRNTSTTWMTQP